MASNQPPAQLTDAEIDNLEFADLRLSGAIIHTSFADKFEYLPAEGFPGGQTMRELIPFDIDERRIALPDRKRAFAFRYTADGDLYVARFFTRIQAGKFN